MEIPYTFEEKQAPLSEPLTPAIRQGPHIRNQHIASLQQDHNRTRQLSQNQNLATVIERQIIHPD